MAEELHDLVGAALLEPDGDAPVEALARRGRARRLRRRALFTVVPVLALVAGLLTVPGLVGQRVELAPAEPGGDAAGTGELERSAVVGDDSGLLREVAADDGGVFGPHEWELTGVSPDERILHVTTIFGGVASGCNRWEGWEVAESDDRVTVAARMWRDPDVEICTDEGHQRDRYVQLERPLGDRDLVGCERDDCRHAALDHWLPGGTVDAASDVVVAGSPAGRFSLAPSDGTLRWHQVEPGGRWQARPGLVLYNDGDQETTSALDPHTGAESWSVAGMLLSGGDGLVLTCHGQAPGERWVTEAYELATGASRWSVESGCGRAVPIDGDLLAVMESAADRHATEVAVVDPADGSERWRVDVGRDGGGGIAYAEERLFVGSSEGMAALDAHDGAITKLDLDAGLPLGASNGTVLVTTHDELVALDTGQGTVLWSKRFDGLGYELPVIVDDGAVFFTDGAAGTIERRAPHDGSMIWQADVGRSSHIDVAVHDDVVYAATSTAAIALDLDTGERHWWTPLVHN